MNLPDPLPRGKAPSLSLHEAQDPGTGGIDVVQALHLIEELLGPVAAQFYGRRRVSREEFLRAVRLGTIVNLLGTETVTMAVAEGLLDAGAVGTLGGIPHAEIVQM